MRKVVFVGLFVAAAATRGFAQAPVIQVVPVAPPTIVPQTVSPATIQMLDAIQAIAQRPIAPVTPAPFNIVPNSPEQTPAPAAPAAPPAPRPARPAPGSAPAQPPPTAATQPPAAPVPPGSKPVPAPNRLIAPRNVRFDIAITDSGGPKPVTKVVSVTVADNNANGSIRNLARLSVAPDANDMYPLNLDVRGVMGFDDGSVRASVNVEYQPYIPDAKIKPGVINASATAVFQDGRKTQILQSTDPLSDRRTTVEVTATILK